MSNFNYTAVDATGKEFRGTIQEKTQTKALRRVKEMGLFPMGLREKVPSVSLAHLIPHRAAPSQAAKPRRKGSVLWIGGISVKALAAFTRQLATQVDAGIPLLKGLRAIDRQERNHALRGVIQSLEQDIEGGSTFSESLSRHPKTFDRLYVNMAVAGETAGMLESTLTRLADFMERSQKIRAKIISSLFYPTAVITVAIAILTVLTVFIIPKFRDIFADMTGSNVLPPFTQFVLNTSMVIRHHFGYVVAGVIGALIALRLITATKSGRRAYDRLKLNLPVVGVIIQKTAISRFARTLGTLLQSGVPILQSLVIAREATPNTIVGQAIGQVHTRVKEGDNITPTLDASGVFPSTVISMVDVGEQTGALPAMLLKVADGCDDEVDNLIAGLMSLLEPALIIFLALVVGSIVIALYLPLFDLVGRGFDRSQGESAE